ncbi:hypothetical protein AMECASPLE_039803 [Ameca splendens]|uniref:TNFR-Cys domain-containing protein n=1 Tax=Ameca splendens TaxID=208324 RepID=A0ABV0XXF5_9TELE
MELSHKCPSARNLVIIHKSLFFSSQMILMRPFRVHTITCHLTEYKIGNECCPMCPPGSRVKTDCTEFRSTSCLPCTDGTYMDRPNGLKRCTPCSTCDSGAAMLMFSTYVLK